MTESINWLLDVIIHEDPVLAESIMAAHQVIFESTLAPAANGRILSAHDYVSPRTRELTEEEAHIRDVAHSIKAPTSPDIEEAALDMAELIPDNSVLVPIPNSRGDTSSNLALATAIAELTNSEVQDILTNDPRESNRMRWISGLDRNGPEKMGYRLTGRPTSNRIFFVDNVSASGASIIGAIKLIGAGRGLVYAAVSGA